VADTAPPPLPLPLFFLSSSGGSGLRYRMMGETTLSVGPFA